MNDQSPDSYEPDNQRLFAYRYQLLDTLGEGGMGMVYRALDRLTRKHVAIKFVTTPLTDLTFKSRSNYNDLRIALAQEFQMLASLRHPNIISVLDYGFDDSGQPFFTMELLDNADTFLATYEDNSLESKVNALIQILQALAYLHRRGILHRDLKPANILAIPAEDRDPVIKILDFGLATIYNQDLDGHEPVGTVAYMAPEIVQQGAPSNASDLFAVGVMAYELLVGIHPFDLSSIPQLIFSIVQGRADFSSLEIMDNPDSTVALSAVIRKLLNPNPEARYQHAHEVIADLSHSIGKPPPPETDMIRESFLQAATFVGRDSELSQLENALDLLLGESPKGSAWIIGGESGVGKSRLLDEIRVRALVKGALVLRGQAVAETQMPLDLWREPLRRLILTDPISDVEAGVLKSLIPDMDDLLGKTISPAPTLDGQASQHRIMDTIIALFNRQTQPTVLILDDLQWAENSLSFIERLNGLTATVPFMVIGSYRHDEQPHLTEKAPTMTPMRLERLLAEEMEQLTVSMLGTAGQNPHVQELLQRETEGNIFFMIEAIRALAETAGSLDEIGQVTIPRHISAGGIQAIIQQRVERVALKWQPALKMAAIAGRELDPKVLTIALGFQDNPTELDAWLLACIEAAVFEVRDEKWRFTHDKLREYILSTIPDNEKLTLHQTIAKAIESVYPDDNNYAVVLTEHWHFAKNSPKERHYAIIAARKLGQTGAHQAAIGYYQRSADLAITEMERLESKTAIGRAYIQLGHDFQAALDILLEVQNQLPKGENRLLEGIILRDLASAYIRLGRRDEALQHIQDSIAVFQELGHRAYEASAWHILGGTYNQIGEFEKALDAASKGLAIDEVTPYDKATLFIQKQQALTKLGRYPEAIESINQCITLLEQLGDQHGLATAYNDLGTIAGRNNNPPLSISYFEKVLKINTTLNIRSGMAIALMNMGVATKKMGDYERGSDLYARAYAIFKEIGMRIGEAITLLNWGNVLEKMGEDDKAREKLQASFRIANDIGARQAIMFGLTSFARLAKNAGDYERSTHLATLSYNHPAQDAKAQEEAQVELDELKELMGEDLFNTAQAATEKLDLDTVIQELIAD